MLASPAEDAAEIMARLGPAVWVEDKYDGIRAQLHRRGRRGRASTAATSTTSAASSRRSSTARRAAPGTASSTASCWPYRDGVVLPVPGPPAAARPQGALRRDPGRGPGRLRGLRRAGRSARGRRCTCRAARSTRPLAGAPGAPGGAWPAAGQAEPARFALSHLVRSTRPTSSSGLQRPRARAATRA